MDVGSYLLVPSTTGCRIKRRKHQPSPEVELVDIEGSSQGSKPSVSLSPKFRQVLTEIFNQIDLDGSGGLSRQEFNLFNWRTSGEEVQDEEWRVVRENFDLVEGELTLGGFMQLHQMEAEDSSGDSAELWVTLNAMGYNYNLEQDEAALFRISARLEKRKSRICLSICQRFAFGRANTRQGNHPVRHGEWDPGTARRRQGHSDLPRGLGQLHLCRHPEQVVFDSGPEHGFQPEPERFNQPSTPHLFNYFICQIHLVCCPFNPG